MKINILTIFPNIFNSFLNEAIVKKAIDSGDLVINIIDIRNYSTNKHNKVDDYVYGGGAGMLIMPEPLFLAFEDHNLQKSHSIFVTPSGKKLTQSKMQKFSEMSEITITCGRYEGIDQRFIDTYVDEEICIGDYVLLGGEVPAMLIMEGITRLLPNVLQNPESIVDESFSQNNNLEGFKYTRPAEFRNMKVPEVLISGHHAKILEYEKNSGQNKKNKNRPDL